MPFWFLELDARFCMGNFHIWDSGDRFLYPEYEVLRFWYCGTLDLECFGCFVIGLLCFCGLQVLSELLIYLFYCGLDIRMAWTSKWHVRAKDEEAVVLIGDIEVRKLRRLCVSLNGDIRKSRGYFVGSQTCTCLSRQRRQDHFCRLHAYWIMYPKVYTYFSCLMASRDLNHCSSWSNQSARKRNQYASV